MSVGLNKAEIQSILAVNAARNIKGHHQLPDTNSGIVLTYPGKLSEDKVLEPINEPYVRCGLNGEMELSELSPNGFVLSDNLLALHNLIQNGTRATLIYLDPPYATGLDFQSRQLEHAYNDSLSDATYVEYMRRRLILMREVLTEDGSIYVHIGHQMLSHLKLVMDEIFGEKNFRNLIVRRKCSSKNFTKNQYSNLNDYILFYSKTNRYKWNKPILQPDEAWLDKEYPKADAKGRYKLVPIHAPGVRRGETGQPWRGKLPPPGKHWQYVPSKLDELDAAGDIHWSKNGNPRRKVYLPPDKSLPVTDYWDKYRDAHHQSIMVTGYPTEKNLDMLKLIVGASSDEGDIVLDPFCGSGTTLHAADDLNRKWIGIDQSFTAAKATLTRMRNGLAPMGDFVKKVEENVVDLFSSVSSNEEADKPKVELESRKLSVFSFYVDAEIANSFASEVDSLAKI